MLMLNNRLTYPESFKQRPEANASITNATANKNWELTGVNAVVGTVVANGIRAATAGADGDQHIVIPQQDASQSILQYIWYRSDLHYQWDNIISLAAASAIPQYIISGLKETADFVPTNNAEALVWFYDTTTNPNWLLIERAGGVTIATIDTGIPVTADAMWRLRFVFNSARKAECWLGIGLSDPALIHTTTAFSIAIDAWKPYFGVEQAFGNPVIFGYHKADIEIDPLIVLPPADADHLEFGIQPVDADVDAIMAVFTVEALRPDGSVDTNFTGDITIELTVPGGATLGGTLTVAAVNGIATFSDITVDTAGTYTFTATSPGLTDGVSDEFEILAVTEEQAIFGADVYEVWDSEENVAVTGANVDSWTGLVRGKVLLPVGEDSPPTVVAGGLNGHDYVNFAHNVDQQLEAAFGESLPQPLTYLAVFTWVNVAAGNSAGIIGGATGDDVRLGIATGNVLWVTSAGDIWNVNGTGGWAGGNSHMLAAIADFPGADEAIVYRGGVVAGSVNTPGGTASITGLNLADDIGVSQANELRFYRVVVLTSHPTNAQLNDWWDAMGTKYGLPYTPLP